MEKLRLEMKLASLENMEEYPLPEGYYFRKYLPGDELNWADIEVAVGDFESKQAALDEFIRSFDSNHDMLNDRQLYLCTKSGEVVGTTTAWMTEKYDPGVHGLIHWVAIKPQYQAKKLGRPLMYAALRLMRNWHSDAFLCTQTHRLRAVRVYLDMGFRPYIRSDEDRIAWQTAAMYIEHPALEIYRKQ